MDALTIGGTAVPVRPTRVQYEDLANREDAFSKRQISSRAGTATAARSLPFEVVGPLLTPTAAKTLVATLLAPGTLEVGGFYFAPGGGTVTCRAVDVDYELRIFPSHYWIRGVLVEEDADA